MSENKYNYLLKNTLIFAIGTFGSKIISFLIVPLYTYILTTSDYGIVDLFTTAINMMIPLTTLLIYEAEIRFLISKEIKKETVLSNSMFILFCTTVLMILCSPIYKSVLGFGNYTYLYVVALFLTTYNSIVNQFLRGTEHNLAFSINGIISTLVFVSSNLLFLIVFKMGVLGYILSMIVAQLAASIQATIVGNIFKYVKISQVNFVYLKMMLKYSIPLIPNSLMWWIMNAGDKYIINYFMGTSANGIYSLAMKIPTILTLFFSIFMQAWQLSAIKEKDSHEQGEFYSNVYKQLLALMFVLSSCIIICVEYIFKALINSSFVYAWKIVPFLCIAAIVNCLATFTGVIYLVDKKSIKSFISTCIGAIVNLVANFLLIRNWGLYGIAIGTFLGYVAIWIYRMKDAKKETGMEFFILKTIICFVAVFVQFYAIVIVNGLSGYLLCFGMLVIIVSMYIKEIKTIISFFGGLIRKRKRT